MAQDIIVTNHYTHAFPASLINFGIFDAGVLKGALCFGRGSNRNVIKFLGTKDYLELTRLWIDDSLGKNTESRAISVGLRLIRKQYPFLKKVISYADSTVGHEGGIYKATGFKYFGVKAKEAGIKIGGKVYHRRSVNSKYGTSEIEVLKKMLKRDDIQSMKGSGKHCFVIDL